MQSLLICKNIPQLLLINNNNEWMMLLLILSLIVSSISLFLHISNKIQTKKIYEDTEEIKKINEKIEKIQRKKEQQQKMKSLQYIITFLESLNLFLFDDLIKAQKLIANKEYDTKDIPIYKSEYEASHTSFHPNTRKSIFYYTFTVEEFYLHLNNVKSILPEENFFFIQNHLMLFNSINQQIPRDISYYEISTGETKKEWQKIENKSYKPQKEEIENYLMELREGHLAHFIRLERKRDFQKREGLLNETLTTLKVAGNLDSSRSDYLDDELREKLNTFSQEEYSL